MIDLPAFGPLCPRASLAALAACVLLGSPTAIAQTPSAAKPAVQSPARAPAVAAAAEAAAPAAAAVPGAPVAAAAGAPRPGRVVGKVELDASQITGNRELPRVLYIVPWREPGTGEVDGQPMNSLVYELIRPVDRDVLRREARYHEGLAGAGTR
jgi:hypothetical protein